MPQPPQRSHASRRWLVLAASLEGSTVLLLVQRGEAPPSEVRVVRRAIRG